MKNFPPKREVVVTYANSNKVQTVQVPQHAPDIGAPPQPSQAESSTDKVAAEPQKTFERESAGQPSSLSPVEAEATSGPVSQLASTDSALSETGSTAAGKKNSGSGKPKEDIETLEQFIAYAYSR